MNPVFYVGADKFERTNQDEWLEWGVNPTYQITLTPRCTPLPAPFAHPCAIQFHALGGKVSFELDGISFVIEPGQIVCVEANHLYRFMGREFSSVVVLCQAASAEVEKDWRRMAQFLRESQALVVRSR